MSNALTFRGKIYTGSVQPYTDDQIDSGDSNIANPMSWLGVVSKFIFTPAVERTKLPEYHTGNDTTFDSWSRVTGGTIEMTCDESKPENLALNLMGVSTVIGPESVAEAYLGNKNTTTKKWSTLESTVALEAGIRYKFVREISDDGYVMVPYELIDSTSFELTDSSTTPKTLTAGTDYILYPLIGAIKLTNTASHGVNLPGITYPLVASFDVGAFIDSLPNPLKNNAEYALSHVNISDYSVKDSSATPKVISDDYYSIDTKAGLIKITDLTAIKAVSGITFPLQVYATRGNTKTVGILASNQIEKQIRVVGQNVRSGQAVIITLYRVSFDASAVDFFDKDWVKTPLKAELLSDPTRPSDDVMGQYGKIEYI